MTSIKLLLVLIAAISADLCSAQDLSAGLVAYYSFCGCTAVDHSGNDNDATLVGNPLCRDGIKGQGFQLNTSPGVNDCGRSGGDYIRLPVLESIWDGGFSVCAWVQYENVANYERIIDIGNGMGDSGGLPLWFGREGNSDNLTLESWVDADPNTNRSTGRLIAENVITNGQIEFYCATIDDRTMRIYVNGELVAEKEGHPIRNVRRTENFIGRSNWCEADPDLKGFIDEVRLYNRPLSAEEIRLLYDSPALVTGSDVVCPGEPVQLKAQGGVRYQWTPSTFLNATDIADPIAIADRDTTINYQVEIFFPDDCSVVDTITLSVDDCIDCAGVPDGSAVVDECGLCLPPDDPNFNQSCLDCAGVPNGNAIIDQCGECLPADDPNFNLSCIDTEAIFIPSAFSPNQDGINDVFRVYGDATAVEKIESFQVKDRWGNLVFEAQDYPLGDPGSAWNGSRGGERLHQGIYVYQAIVLFKNGALRTITGTVTLIY